jgi:PKD repeat protein
MGTRDLLWTPQQGGTFPLIERGLSLTDPGVSPFGTVPGGMQTCLAATGTVPNNSPTADAGGAYNGIEGIPLSLDGSASFDPDGDPLTYTWDFGDSSGGTGVTLSHTYASDGAYTVELTVDDGNGGSSTDTTMATIAANLLPIADPDGPYDVRAIDFPPSQTVLPITFDGTGSSDPEDQPLTYRWDFGDGNGGSGASPEHTYADDSGSPYTVTLTARISPAW